MTLPANFLKRLRETVGDFYAGLSVTITLEVLRSLILSKCEISKHGVERGHRISSKFLFLSPFEFLTPLAMIDPTQHKLIRTSGWLYLLLAVSAPFGLLYVPGKITVPGNAAATAENVKSFEDLIRIGIASELFHQALVIFLVFVLYKLFKPVDEHLSRLLVALGALVSVPIMFVNVLNYFAAFLILKDPGFIASFEQSQLDILAFLFIRLHDKGIIIASIFWGLWLFPFGMLAIRSGFIPRVYGYLLLLAGSGYVIAAATNIVLPAYSSRVGQVTMILEMGELPIILWLFIRGLRPLKSSVV